MLKNLLIAILGVILLSSCASQIRTKYTTTKMFDLVDKNMAKQSKGGIEIEVKPVNDDFKKKSYFTQKIKVMYIPILSDQVVAENIPFEIDYFDGLTTFEVNIVNNTNHILRMRDSRVVFIDPDSDEPVMGLDKSTILDDFESTIPYYNTLIKYITKNYDQTPPEIAETQVIRALQKITKKLKFINGFNKEIMPGMRAKGIIMFPVSPEQASQGKISFIDMVSKTDKAGNPTEKVRFDYSVKVLNRYWKYNAKTDKDWVEISASDYQKGVQKTKK